MRRMSAVVGAVVVVFAAATLGAQDRGKGKEVSKPKTITG